MAHLGRPIIRPFAEESARLKPEGRRRAPPKEQPPWNLSGTRDRKGDDSLERERSDDERSTDGVGGVSREISQVLMTDRVL